MPDSSQIILDFFSILYYTKSRRKQFLQPLINYLYSPQKTDGSPIGLLLIIYSPSPAVNQLNDQTHDQKRHEYRCKQTDNSSDHRHNQYNNSYNSKDQNQFLPPGIKSKDVCAPVPGFAAIVLFIRILSSSSRLIAVI